MEVYAEWWIWKDMSKSSFREDFIQRLYPWLKSLQWDTAWKAELMKSMPRLCVRLAVSLRNCAVSGTRQHFPPRCLRSRRSGWCPQSWGPAGTPPGSRWSLFRWRDRRRFLAKDKAKKGFVNCTVYGWWWKIRAHSEKKSVAFVVMAVKQMRCQQSHPCALFFEKKVPAEI